MMQRAFAWQGSYLSFAVALLLAFALALIPENAWAAVAGSFTCSNGHASGQLYDTGNGTCPTTMKFSNVFSFLVCHTEQLSANLMGSMYCSIVDRLEFAVTAMVTLAVLFFGVTFTLGVTQMTAKEFQVILLKIAFVYGFATQADLIIGIGYNLLVSGLRDGTAIAVSSLYSSAGTPTNGLGVYQLLDSFLAKALHFATDAVGQKWVQGENPCKNAIFAVMAIMAIVLPPVFYLCVLLIIRISLTFLRAIFGYLYSLLGITFLLCLSPFFLSFYLFRRTNEFFKKWLNHLISFSLQIVIVFAFLAFVVSIKVDNITSSLTDIIMPATQTKEATGFRKLFTYCTVCKFDVVDKTDHTTVLTSDADILSKGELKCKDPKTPLTVFEANAQPPDANEQNTLIKFATHGLLALVVLAYIVDMLLSIIPILAENLSIGYAEASGFGVPGFGLLNTVERSFEESFSNNTNSVTGLVEGFKTATKRLVVGERGADGELSPTDPGLVGNFMNFIRDPQRPEH